MSSAFLGLSDSKLPCLSGNRPQQCEKQLHGSCAEALDGLQLVTANHPQVSALGVIPTPMCACCAGDQLKVPLRNCCPLHTRGSCVTTSLANQTMPQRLTVASVAYFNVSTSNMIRTFLRQSAANMGPRNVSIVFCELNLRRSTMM